MTFVIAAGVWNTAWYGVQNIPSFWGVAALVSGVFMLFVAQLIYLEVKNSSLVQYALFFYLKLIAGTVLGVCLLLYATTIIQFNLG